jgi:hypothetical protein
MFDEIKKNWATVRADPNKWNVFNVKVIQIFIGVISVVVAWQFIKLIIGFNAGNSTMTMVGRLITFALMVFILYKVYKVGYLQLRDRILHNGNVPEEQQKIVKYTNEEIDDMINKTIDDIENNSKAERRNK